MSDTDRTVINPDQDQDRTAITKEWTKVVDQLTLLIKNDAVYQSKSHRIINLADSLASNLRGLDETGASITIVGDQFVVGECAIPASGPRADLFKRLRSLNVRAVHINPKVSTDDLVTFAGRINQLVRQLLKDQSLTPDWATLPLTIRIEAAYYTSGDSEGGILSNLPIRDGRVIIENVQEIVTELQELRDSLQSADGDTLPVDIIDALLDTLKEVETLAPEQAEELIQQTISRLKRTLERSSSERIPPKLIDLFEDVSKKYFSRSPGDDEADDLDEIPERDEGAAGEDGTPISAFQEEMDEFLCEGTRLPDLTEPDEGSFLEILLQFLTGAESPHTVEAVAGHLIAMLEQSDDEGFEETLRESVLRSLEGASETTPLKPLISRLINNRELEAMMSTLDFGSAKHVERFGQMAKSLWPEVLTPLYTHIRGKPKAVQQEAFAAIMRSVGRSTVLNLGSDLLRLEMFNREGFQRWLRDLKIPEVLPLYEVMFSSADAEHRLTAFTTAQQFPFRDASAFFLYAATQPSDVSGDYFYSLLSREWEGVFDDDELFQESFGLAVDATKSDDSDEAAFGIRALSFADTDQAADVLIALLKEKRWGVLPVRSRKMRQLAQSSLESMLCQRALYWTLELKG